MYHSPSEWFWDTKTDQTARKTVWSVPYLNEIRLSRGLPLVPATPKAPNSDGIRCFLLLDFTFLTYLPEKWVEVAVVPPVFPSRCSPFGDAPSVLCADRCPP